MHPTEAVRPQPCAVGQYTPLPDLSVRLHHGRVEVPVIGWRHVNRAHMLRAGWSVEQLRVPNAVAEQAGVCLLNKSWDMSCCLGTRAAGGNCLIVCGGNACCWYGELFKLRLAAARFSTTNLPGIWKVAHTDESLFNHVGSDAGAHLILGFRV